MDRTLACEARGRAFESRRACQTPLKWGIFSSPEFCAIPLSLLIGAFARSTGVFFKQDFFANRMALSARFC